MAHLVKGLPSTRVMIPGSWDAGDVGFPAQGKFGSPPSAPYPPLVLSLFLKYISKILKRKKEKEKSKQN